MTTGQFRRARRPDQIRQRRVAILNAAGALLDQDGADGVSLNRIARWVGLAKSNLYRYFKSREAILLALLLEDLQGWSDEVESRLAPLAGRNSPAAVAEAVVSSLVSRPRLCELTSALVSSLGRAPSDDTVGDVGERMRVATAKTAASLRAALPSVPAGRADSLPRVVLGLAAALWPMTRPTSPGQAPTDHRDCEPAPSFGGELEAAVRALLYGLLVESWRASGRRVTPP